MDCYTNNFPGLPCFKKLTADKHVLAELLLVPFVIINSWRDESETRFTLEEIFPDS